MKKNKILNSILWGTMAFLHIIPQKAMADETTGNYSNAYDLVVNGASLNGYYVAMEAVGLGMKVLLLDKRTSPGYDVVAKRRLWLKDNGVDKWNKATLDLFFPVEEQEENWNSSLLSPRRSWSQDELILFAGSLKKQMMKNLLDQDVDVLLMNDVCGVLTDNAKRVTGVVTASKHGVFSIQTKCFVDATDHNFFTRNLFGYPYSIKDASFVLEFDQVKPNSLRFLQMPGLGLVDDELRIHKSKKSENLYLLEYTFPVTTNDLSTIEQQARDIALKISSSISSADSVFSESRLFYTALECSYTLEKESMAKPIPLENYHYVRTEEEELSCRSVLQMQTSAKNLVDSLQTMMAPDSTAYVYFACGRKKYSDIGEPVLCEEGIPTPLRRFPVGIIEAKEEKTPLLIAGGGTAGSMVAWGAAEKDVPVTVLEYFNDLGGTKTMGGVNDFYFGNRNHKLIKKIEANRKQFAEAHGLALGRSTVSRRFFYLDTLLQNGVRVINGAIICGVGMSGNHLTTIYASENGKMRKFKATLTVDATGDADIAYFAGEDYSIGDSRMGVTQNYSHWDVAYKPKQKDYNRDYDIINSTEVLEYQRGLYLAHAEAHYYDFYPMQAVRESRRPEAVYEIGIADILRATQYEDVIAQARSDYDPHYFSNTELSRCGLMLPHFDNGELVNIPYRAIVPCHVDGLLYAGKSFGLTYEAFQFTRMSADVTVLGYVTGLLSADILKEKVLPRDFSVKNVQDDLVNKGFLPADFSKESNYTLSELVSGLEKDDETCLLKTCVENKEDILPLLKATFNRRPNLLLAKALAWFGDASGVCLIKNELEQLYAQELQDGHSNLYFEAYDHDILYWKINQDIGLLAKCATTQSDEIIRSILNETSSGGSKVFSLDAYTHGRIDLQLLPYYNRIVNLCFYIERNPDNQFICGLEKLLDDMNIRGHKTKDYDKTRWKLYNANLELLLASSAARCGSKVGLDVLVDYLDDIHSDFRKFAHKELKQISEKDYGYDMQKWMTYIENCDSLGLVPLQ